MSMLLFSHWASKGGGTAPPLTLTQHTCCPPLHSFQPPLHTTCRSRQPWTKSCSRQQHLHRPHLVQPPQLGGAGRGGATPMWGPPPWPLWCPMCPRWHPHPMHQPSWHLPQPSLRPQLLLLVLHLTQTSCIVMCTVQGVEEIDKRQYSKVKLSIPAGWPGVVIVWACCSYTLA